MKQFFNDPTAIDIAMHGDNACIGISAGVSVLVRLGGRIDRWTVGRMACKRSSWIRNKRQMHPALGIKACLNCESP